MHRERFKFGSWLLAAALFVAGVSSFFAARPSRDPASQESFDVGFCEAWVDPSLKNFRVDEDARFEDVNRVAKVVGGNDFVTDRGLLNDGDQNYDDWFRGSELFKDYLLALKQDERWLDIGAGDAGAFYEYNVLLKGVAEMVGLSVAGPRLREANSQIRYKKLVANAGERFSYKTGRLEHFSPEMLKSLGLFQAITDIYAAMSYTGHQDKVLARELSLLASGGRLFFTMRGEHFKIYGANGPVPTKEWLEAVKGAKLLRYATGTLPDEYGVIFERTSGPIEVPALRQLKYFVPSGDYIVPIQTYHWAR